MLCSIIPLVNAFPEESGSSFTLTEGELHADPPIIPEPPIVVPENFNGNGGGGHGRRMNFVSIQNNNLLCFLNMGTEIGNGLILDDVERTVNIFGNPKYLPCMDEAKESFIPVIVAYFK